MQKNLEAEVLAKTKKANARANSRNKKKKPKMKVSGRSVISLKKIIEEK